MRTLYLFRHAKSDWDDPSLDDYDRPLAPRGRRAAPAMGRWMAAAGVAPDLVLCSTAARAQQTALLAFEAAAWPPRVIYRPALYLTDSERILSIIQAEGGPTASIMVIGHNPGLHDLALRLSAGEESGARDQIADKFPTAALATIQFGAASWMAVGAQAGRLTQFQTPRNLPEYEDFRA
ncbi:MAG: histidine phosphatase family protein [Pseudomonadota bacterium]